MYRHWLLLTPFSGPWRVLALCSMNLKTPKVSAGQGPWLRGGCNVELGGCLNGPGLDFAAQSRQPFQEVHCAQDLDPATWPPADSAGGPGLPLCPVSSAPDVLCPLASGPLQGLVSLSLPERPEDRPSWGQVWAPEGRE